MPISFKMAEYEDRERYIPFTTSDIVDMLIRGGELEEDEKKCFKDFVDILENTFHYDFFEKVEELEDLYFPFDPDTDKTSSQKPSKKELKSKSSKFFKKFDRLLKDGNFSQIREGEIKEALQKRSELAAVDVDVDLTDFKNLQIYKRGESTVKEEVPKYSFFKSFLKEEVEIDIYNRILMVLRFQSSYEPEKSSLGEDVDPDYIYLKNFKNVPKKDIEMIFPNSKVKMRVIDRLKIALPILIGTGAGMAKLLDLVKGEYSLILTLSLGIALAGYVIKSYVSYKNTILDYTKSLLSGLYFRNLGNNSSMIQYAVNEAEEEETKEAILGCYFLLKSEEELTQRELDNEIEDWFEENGVKIDFEVEDALNKLQDLGLTERVDEVWKVLDLEGALERLDHLWDNYYKYN